MDTKSIGRIAKHFKTSPAAGSSRKHRAVRSWRLILAVAKAARRASLELGPKGVAQAAGYALIEADTEIYHRAAALLVSLEAKGLLGRGIDLREMARLVTEHRTTPADCAALPSLLRAG